jgi:hypothetical protein
MKKNVCEICNQQIPKERLEILPDTKTCVKCSQIKRYTESDIFGFQISNAQQNVYPGNLRRKGKSRVNSVQLRDKRNS